MPNEFVTLLTDIAGMAIVTERANNSRAVYDTVFAFPSTTNENDPFKIENDLLVYEMSPYEYTIKLEADMFVPHDISWWFDVLKDRDVAVCSTIRDYNNRISDSRFYRRVLDANLLPDTYNAITYFKKSDAAKQFFATARQVYNNWAEFQEVYALNQEEPPSTDEVYAIAAEIIGREHVVMPLFTEMSMIHMKSMITGTALEEWPNQITHELCVDNFKLDTIPQLYPVHYHVKSFADVLYQELRGLENE
jgi:hypothetical protein